MSSCKRKHRRLRNDKLLQDQRSNPKKFWNFIKNLGGSVNNDLPDSVSREDGSSTKDPALVREEWMKYFKNLLNPTAPQNVDQPSNEPNIQPLTINPQLESVELNEEISIEEVEIAIQANNDHKSPGVDGTKPAYLKNTACVKFVNALCNHCFRTGTVPSTWLEAIIKPIPKANKKSTLPSEYRGISLQSFVAKTYCRIMNNRLKDFLEINNILSDEQNGFRPDRYCQDHIFSLTSIIENRMLGRKYTFACFIDFRKAFDCVNKEMFWEKIETRYKVNGNLLIALKALYSKVSCAANVNSELTGWFTVDSGVKQGCILSPTLFAMFIDDLVDNLNSIQAGIECGKHMVSTLLYADDIVILAPDEDRLERLPRIVESWCHRWNMNLNLSKTNIVHFRKRKGIKSRSTHKFYFNDNNIAFSNQYKYLGLTITEHLDWNTAFEEICTKANRALALLNHRSRIC